MPPSVQTLGERREYSVRESKKILQTPCGVFLAEKLTFKTLGEYNNRPDFTFRSWDALDRKIDLEIITCKLAAAKEFHEIKPALKTSNLETN